MMMMEKKVDTETMESLTKRKNKEKVEEEERVKRKVEEQERVKQKVKEQEKLKQKADRARQKVFMEELNSVQVKSTLDSAIAKEKISSKQTEATKVETTKSVAIIENFFFGKLLQNLPQKTRPTKLDIICKYLYEMWKIAEKSSTARRFSGIGNRVVFSEDQKYKKQIIKSIRCDLIVIWKGFSGTNLASDEEIDLQIENLLKEALTFVNSPQVKEKSNSSQQWIQKIRKEKYGDIFQIYSHNDRPDEDGISSENDLTEKTQMELLRKSRKNKQNDNEERCRASENHFTKKTQMELLTRSRKNKQDDLVVVRKKISSKQKDAYDDVEYFCRSSANDFTEKTQRKQLYDDQHQGLLACFIKSYCKYEK